MLTTKIKSAEHLEEHELNKILKHLSKNEEWLYYLIVRLGVSTALRFSDLSQIKWSDVLNKEVLLLNEKKTGKRREIPLGKELSENLKLTYKKLGWLRNVYLDNPAAGPHQTPVSNSRNHSVTH